MNNIKQQAPIKTIKEWTTLEQLRKLKQDYDQEEVLPFTCYKEGTISLFLRKDFKQP